MKFILASSSPRRRELLLRLQTPFDIILPDVDESIIPPDGSPETYCTALAELKANNISQHYPNNLVIGSDTIVVLDDQIMGNQMINHRLKKCWNLSVEKPIMSILASA